MYNEFVLTEYDRLHPPAVRDYEAEYRVKINRKQNEENESQLRIARAERNAYEHYISCQRAKIKGILKMEKKLHYALMPKKGRSQRWPRMPRNVNKNLKELNM
jgi:hypothetical protein